MDNFKAYDELTDDEADRLMEEEQRDEALYCDEPCLESSMAVGTIDRDTQARTQLETLGYALGEKVFLRFFYPKWHEKYKDDKGAKSEFIFPNIPWVYIDRLQSDGRGCYFVVNGQGPKDENVLNGKAVFYEHDDLSKELQLDLWKTLELPVPTIQIDTGGKSIHSYWVFDEPIDIADWKALQTDLLDFSKGDRKIKNESRVMRLAGALHIGEGGNNQSVIVSNSGTRHNFDTLRSIVPNKSALSPVYTRSKAPKPLRMATEASIKTVETSVSSIPSLDDIRKALGFLSPDCDYGQWVHIGMALHSQDINLLDEWDRWSSGAKKEHHYQEGLCATKWESFRSDGINIYKLFQIAKDNGFKYQDSFNSSSVTADEIRNHQPEVETRFSWDSVRDGFPADINLAYEKANSYLAIEADVVALSLVAALSSELSGLCSTDTDNPLNNFVLLVGESGSGKTGKINAVIKGLYAIDDERTSVFKGEESQYKRDIADYEVMRKQLKDEDFNEEEPIKPTKNNTIIQNVTGECLLEMLQNQEAKNRGLLAYYDEFKTFLGAMNKYNSGGDERSRFLSIHSGALTQSNTKSGGEIRVKNPKLSIIGGIQPKTLMQDVAKTGTEDGWWARLLLAKTYKSTVVHRFDRIKSQAAFLQTVVETYVTKIQQISGQLRSEMTEETIDLRYETEVRYVKDLDIAVNREAHLKTIDHVDRVATVLSLLEYLYNNVQGNLAPVYPHHYSAALSLCENSLAIWEELTQTDIEKDETELVQKAYKIGKTKNKLDAKILQHWAKGEKAQNLIKLVHETYGGTLTTGRQKTFIWTP